MIAKIVGFKKNSGVLENGVPWSNYTVNVLKEENGVNGYCVQSLKVKPNVLQNCFENAEDMLEQTVSIDFDTRNYGGKVSIIVSDITIFDRKENV